MITKYFEIEKAHLTIVALDSIYEVKFAYETEFGYTWEFDRMSDAVNQKTSKRTGNIQVLFVPSEDTMSFPEDAKRPRTYVMSIEKARMLYRTLTRFPNYWFALDMANLAAK